MSVAVENGLILKFRSIFPDKSRRELKNIFIDMTKSVYKNVGKDEKMSEDARNRWGAVAASLRSLNLIEFKIAMYRFKSAGLTFEEIRRVFIYLDTSGNGRVEYEEFLAGIRVRYCSSQYLIMRYHESLHYELSQITSTKCLIDCIF